MPSASGGDPSNRPGKLSCYDGAELIAELKVGNPRFKSLVVKQQDAYPPILRRVGEQILGCVLMYGHTISYHPVVGFDHLQMVHRANPHCVGIDESLNSIGAPILARLRYERFNYGISHN